VTLQALTVITAAVALGLGASTALAAVQVPWATQAGGGNVDNGNAISTLPDGSAIVTGYFQDTATFGSTTLTSAGGSLDVFVAKFLVAPQAAAATTTTTTLRPTVLPSRARLISGQAMRLGIRTTNTGTGTTRSSATNPALTTTQSRAIRISPRTARTPVTG
jgi:hypothetical protein